MTAAAIVPDTMGDKTLGYHKFITLHLLGKRRRRRSGGGSSRPRSLRCLTRRSVLTRPCCPCPFPAGLLPSGAAGILSSLTADMLPAEHDTELELTQTQERRASGQGIGERNRRTSCTHGLQE